MAQTINIVVLVLENRSFDHMLGVLKTPDWTAGDAGVSSQTTRASLGPANFKDE